MNILHHDLTSCLTYLFLVLSVIALWIPIFKKIPLWAALFICAIIVGMISRRIDLVGVVDILLVFLCTYSLQNQSYSILRRSLYASMLFLLGAAMQIHRLPGFNNLQILNQVQISKDGVPFSLYFNFDKVAVGLLILAMLHQRISSGNEWRRLIKESISRASLVILALMGLSLGLHYVRFDPKIPASLLIWAGNNLFFVCVAEEGFFRGFIQKYLCIAFKNTSYGNIISILIASLLFGLQHYSGGALYVALASCAGIGYGWIYWRTQRIEASIISHFLLNLTHILLFTYPALAAGH